VEESDGDLSANLLISVQSEEFLRKLILNVAQFLFQDDFPDED
jgi:hypothetical protein